MVRAVLLFSVFFFPRWNISFSHLFFFSVCWNVNLQKFRNIQFFCNKISWRWRAWHITKICLNFFLCPYIQITHMQHFEVYLKKKSAAFETFVCVCVCVCVCEWVWEWVWGEYMDNGRKFKDILVMRHSTLFTEYWRSRFRAKNYGPVNRMTL
jgi:hypothetical protein